MWNLDGEAVAKGIDQAHREISVLQYNDENSLSCTINLAFYFAREYYTVIRELPTGKGFADICFIPRKLYADKPAAVIELKWDKDAHGAISQIKEKQYGIINNKIDASAEKESPEYGILSVFRGFFTVQNYIINIKIYIMNMYG